MNQREYLIGVQQSVLMVKLMNWIDFKEHKLSSHIYQLFTFINGSDLFFFVEKIEYTLTIIINWQII